MKVVTQISCIRGQFRIFSHDRQNLFILNCYTKIDDIPKSLLNAKVDYIRPFENEFVSFIDIYLVD